MKNYLVIILIGILFLFMSSPFVVAEDLTHPDNLHTVERPAKTAGADNGNDSREFQTLDSMSDLYEPYLKNISAYKPMCFLMGLDFSKSRFQFSFKYRFLNPALSVSQKHNWIQGFHLAYTQTSFWDLRARSVPFKDTSYKPELFFQTPKNVRFKGCSDA